MTSELDPGLRRLFAATAESPADEAFVAAVTVRTAREARLVLMGRVLACALALAALIAATETGIVAALNQGLGAVAALVVGTPAGWAAGLAIALAAAVCVRTIAPLVGSRR